METTPHNGGKQTEAQRKGQPAPASANPDTSSGTRARPQSIQRTSANFSPAGWSGHPLDTMMRLSREMDQLIDSFFGGRFGTARFAQAPQSGTLAPELWAPRIDVRQRDDALVIHAELPGVPRDAIRIETTDEGIALSGERRETREADPSERGYELSERYYGSFYRSIPLPDGAQPEQAKAAMRDGVLEIVVPLKQSAQRRRIEISG
jgi:HSP20 family protein